jgi:hypothetical protein
MAAPAQALGDRVHARLRSRFPDLPVEVKTLTSNYYGGLRLLIGAESVTRDYVELADVGVFDWMAKLTSNRRMRFVAAGLGIQLLPLLFRA